MTSKVVQTQKKKTHFYYRNVLSEETDIADDISANVFVEFLGDAFVLHHEVLAKRGTRELNMQLALLDEDLLRIARNGLPHHLRPRLSNTILQQRRLQALLLQESQQNILKWLRVIPHNSKLKIED